MTTYKFWTGPAGVREWADKLRAANIDVTLEGTEHVYFGFFHPDGVSGVQLVLESLILGFKLACLKVLRAY